MSFYYKCENPEIVENSVIGNGECVTYIRKLGLPQTIKWKMGIKVFGNEISKGTIIATFVEGVYPQTAPLDGKSMHAAIFDSINENGEVFVWDQWVGQVVHKRLIKNRNGEGRRSNDISTFSIVLTDDGEIETMDLIHNISLTKVEI